MLRIVALIIFSCLVASCGKDTTVVNKKTQLSGEIINPAFDYFILTQKRGFRDTIFLDENNRFSHTFDTEHLGLINFVHNEQQLIHIEKGDSIEMSLDTNAFDESLKYTGKGAKKNTFLRDMHLFWENEVDIFDKNYQKEPKEFLHLLDSLQSAREKTLKQFIAENRVSQEFLEIAKVSASLDNYGRKEAYPLKHPVEDKLSFIESLPEGFYSFRESIDINNPNFFELYNYERYVDAFVDHQTFLRYGDKEVYNNGSYAHVYNKVNVIDKHILDTRLKDIMLHFTARIFLANSNDNKGARKLVTHLNHKVHHPKIKSAIERLHSTHKKMEAGKIISDVTLIEAYTNRKVMLKSLLQKPTVIYFWTDDNPIHIVATRRKITNLSAKFPEYDFIGININTESDMWRRQLEKYAIENTKQYRFENSVTGKIELLVQKLEKIIIVDKDGMILNAFSNLKRPDFEEELVSYIKP